jgi:phosphoribosylglycinamide formyltransferase-1
VQGDLAGLVRARRLARHTMRNIRQNLVFAFGYNALGIPLAAGVLYPVAGVLLNPMVASATAFAKLGFRGLRVRVNSRPLLQLVIRGAGVDPAGVDTAVVDHKQYPSREAFDAAVVEVLRAHGAKCIVLAGFMRLITPVLLDAFPHRVVNIHPALLPAFPGVHAQRQALEYGVRVTGCTVHLVDTGMDTGPILAQATVPVLDNDDEETLRERLLTKEHELLPAVLQWLADDRVEIVPAPAGSGGVRPRVRIRPAR